MPGAPHPTLPLQFGCEYDTMGMGVAKSESGGALFFVQDLGCSSGGGCSC
jgi:hypothetical protein